MQSSSSSSLGPKSSSRELKSVLIAVECGHRTERGRAAGRGTVTRRSTRWLSSLLFIIPLLFIPAVGSEGYLSSLPPCIPPAGDKLCEAPTECPCRKEGRHARKVAVFSGTVDAQLVIQNIQKKQVGPEAYLTTRSLHSDACYFRYCLTNRN